MNKYVLSASLVVYLFALSNNLWAASFTVKEIKIKGLQSVDRNIILSSIPIAVGGLYKDHMTGNIVRSLFKTGFFDDVSVHRQGNTLLLNVRERSAVSQITYQGNSQLSNQQLRVAAKRVGIRTGAVFSYSALAKLKLEILRLYRAKGIYEVIVRPKMKKLSNGQTGIVVDIIEGNKGPIQQVKIIGNRAFSDAQLLKQLNLGQRSWFNFLNDKEQYSRQKMKGGLERLRSFYYNHGYLNFQIIAPRVSFSKDKRSIDIKIKVIEGDQYRVGNINVLGTGLSVSAINQAMQLKKGHVYSQELLEKSRRAIQKRVEKGGFSSVKIHVQPHINRVTKTVDLNLRAEKGERIYVRRIQFRGNYRTKEQVFRREMRQFESSWLSREKILQSKRRLQRLSFVSNVSIYPVPVAGAKDQVDLEITIEERSSNQFEAGVTYSQNYGILFNIGLKQNNFMGLGKRVGIKLNHGKSARQYSFDYFNPYYTIEGVGRGFKVYYSKNDYSDDETISSYKTNHYGANVNYSFPLTENDSLRLSLGLDHREIVTGSESPQHIVNFINQHGGQYNQLVGKLGYVHDTRDRRIFPSEGNRHSLTFETGLPGSDLSYYKLRYRGAQYWSLSPDLTLSLKANIAYGDGLDNLDRLPFFERFYAGGIGSVRGFEKNSMGEKDSNSDAMGGGLVTTGSVELSFPAPFAKEMKTLRLNAFLDAGNVFDSSNDFDVNDIRYSAGIGVTWLTPLGPALNISYAKPLNAEDGDEEQAVQFSLGTNF